MKMAPIPSNFRPIIRLLTENLRKLVLILMRFRFDPLVFKQALRHVNNWTVIGAVSTLLALIWSIYIYFFPSSVFDINIQEVSDPNRDARELSYTYFRIPAIDLIKSTDMHRMVQQSRALDVGFYFIASPKAKDNGVECMLVWSKTAENVYGSIGAFSGMMKNSGVLELNPFAEINEVLNDRFRAAGMRGGFTDTDIYVFVNDDLIPENIGWEYWENGRLLVQGFKRE